MRSGEKNCTASGESISTRQFREERCGHACRARLVIDRLYHAVTGQISQFRVFDAKTVCVNELANLNAVVSISSFSYCFNRSGAPITFGHVEGVPELISTSVRVH